MPRQPLFAKKRRSRRTRAIALVVLSGLGLAAVAGWLFTTLYPSSEDFHVRALDHHRVGELSASIIQLKNALRADPGNVEARVSLGVIYLDVGDLAAARKELERARALGADISTIIEPLSRTWLLQQDYARVLDGLSPDGLDGPTRAIALVARGRAFAGLGQLDKAGEAILSAIQADAQNVDAWMERARLSIQSNDRDTAEEAFEKLAELAPDNLEAAALRGDMFLREGDFGAAAAQYRHVITRLPTHASTKVALANALMAQGIESEATEVLDDLLQQRPNSADANYLGAVNALGNGDYRTALDSAKRALIGNPLHVPSLLIAAISELSFGRLGLAERRLRQTLVQAPGHTLAERLLAETQERRRRLARERTFSNLIDVSSPPAIVASAVGEATDNRSVSTIGVAYLAARRHDHSADPLQRNGAAAVAEARQHLAARDSDAAFNILSGALAQSPGSALIKMALIETYLHQDRVDEALRVIESDAPNEGSAAEALALAAVGYLLTNEADEARLALRSLEELAPEAPEVQLMLAVAYRRLGDAKAHRTRLESSLRLDPNSTAALVEQTRLALWESRLDRAEASLAKLSSIETTEPTYLDLAGGVALLRSDIDEATRFYSRAYAHEPTALRALRLSYAENRAGRPTKSREVLEDWLRNQPGDAAVAVALANRHLTAGNLVEAAELYSAVLRQEPDNVVAINNLAWVSLQLGNSDIALMLARQGHDLAPDDPRIMDTLAEILVSQGHHDDALPLLRRAVRADGTDPGTQARLARVLTQTGSIDEARTLLRRLLDTHSAFPGRQEAESLLAEIGG